MAIVSGRAGQEIIAGLGGNHRFPPVGAFRAIVELQGLAHFNKLNYTHLSTEYRCRPSR
jgi:hypothetical protein